jgi:hypothetical protein
VDIRLIALGWIRAFLVAKPRKPYLLVIAKQDDNIAQ